MGSLKALPNISMTNKSAIILCQSQQPSINIATLEKPTNQLSGSF